MDTMIRAAVGASHQEIEAILGQVPASVGLEVLETDGLDGDVLSIILTSAATVEGIRSIRLVLLALIAKDRRVRLSRGSTEIDVSSPAALERLLSRLERG